MAQPQSPPPPGGGGSVSARHQSRIEQIIINIQARQEELYRAQENGDEEAITNIKAALDSHQDDLEHHSTGGGGGGQSPSGGGRVGWSTDEVLPRDTHDPADSDGAGGGGEGWSDDEVLPRDHAAEVSTAPHRAAPHRTTPHRTHHVHHTAPYHTTLPLEPTPPNLTAHAPSRRTGEVAGRRGTR